MRQTVAAGDVDRAEHPPGARIVHRRRRARPGLHPPYEVLGREHLHGPVHGDRGPRRVRADRGLRPACSRHEVHAVRPPSGRRITLHPQQPALRVAHGQQMFAVRRERAQQLADQRHHPGQRMLRAIGAEVAVRQLHRRGALRPHAGLGRTPPRVGHHGTDRPCHRAALGERLMGTAQHPHPLDGVGSRLQSHPWIGQLGLPSDIRETFARYPRQGPSSPPDPCPYKPRDIARVARPYHWCPPSRSPLQTALTRRM